MMKRFFALLCGSVLLLSTLAGCKGTYTLPAGITRVESPLDDYFESTAVSVILTREATEKKQDYTLEDFPNIALSRVWNASSQLHDCYIGRASIEESVATEIQNTVDFSTYQQLLYVRVKEETKENVLKVAEQIKKLDFVEWAEPGYLEPAWYMQEEKEYCQATVDEDFEEDKVYVEITRKYTERGITFTPEDFANIQAESVKSRTFLYDQYYAGKFDTLTAEEQDYVSSMLGADMRQVLEIDFPDLGKEHVLQVIKELEKLDFVLMVYPVQYNTLFE